MFTKTIFKYGSSENYAISRPFWFRLQLLQNYYTTHSVNLFEKLLSKEQTLGFLVLSSD